MRTGLTLPSFCSHTRIAVHIASASFSSNRPPTLSQSPVQSAAPAADLPAPLGSSHHSILAAHHPLILILSFSSFRSRILSHPPILPSSHPLSTRHLPSLIATSRIHIYRHTQYRNYSISLCSTLIRLVPLSTSTAHIPPLVFLPPSTPY